MTSIASVAAHALTSSGSLADARRRTDPVERMRTAMRINKFGAPSLANKIDEAIAADWQRRRNSGSTRVAGARSKRILGDDE